MMDFIWLVVISLQTWGNASGHCQRQERGWQETSSVSLWDQVPNGQEGQEEATIQWTGRGWVLLRSMLEIFSKMQTKYGPELTHEGRMYFVSLKCHLCSKYAIDPSHKSHNASDKYPTMHHIVTEMCTRAHFCYKMVHCGIWDCWIVGFVILVQCCIQYYVTIGHAL